ncbi:MAG: C39 family peptidase [Anaerolineales bacterium]|nr:C39 family peptidase [Anaerolineales bacterium]
MIAEEETLSSAEIVSPFAEHILQHLLYQGNRNDCAPFTAATLIHAFTDQRINPNELAQQMNHPIWRSGIPVIRRIPNWATFPWGIVDILRQYGLSARWQLFIPVQELTHHLASQILYLPIILSWRPLWAHVMTLIAYHSRYGFGFANTQSTRKEIDWLAKDRFLRLWNSAFHCTVIVAPYGDVSRA